MHINDGLVLNHGTISYLWLNIHFWRTFLALFLHTFQLLALQSLALKLGVFSNKEVSGGINDEIRERPAENVVMPYGFIKQAFFHKAVSENEEIRKKR